MSNPTETNTPNALEAQQAQAAAPQSRSRRVFMPRADIYETPEAVLIYAEMPGVDEKSVDITIEKNVLAITGCVERETWPQNVRLAYEEYEIGDYRRLFTLTDTVDREKIEATLKQGVLKVTLPKFTPEQARKIHVKAQ